MCAKMCPTGICKYIYIYIYIYGCIHLYTHICTHKWIYTYVCINTYTYICMCIHTHIYLYIWIYTRTYMHNIRWSKLQTNMLSQLVGDANANRPRRMKSYTDSTSMLMLFLISKNSCNSPFPEISPSLSKFKSTLPPPESPAHNSLTNIESRAFV